MNIADIKKNLEPICKKENIQKAILFGSYATGNNTAQSDIDLIFIKDTNERFLDRLNDNLFKNVIEALENKAVDILIYNEKEYNAISGRKFFQRIKREGITLYESD
jgi:predicted nucleotidyltransferase